jgi:hypothetical protein
MRRQLLTELGEIGMKKSILFFILISCTLNSNISFGASLGINEPKSEYTSIFNNPVNNAVILRSAITESAFREGPPEMHLKYNILYAPKLYDRWKIVINSDEIKDIFLSDGHNKILDSIVLNEMTAKRIRENINTDIGVDEFVVNILSLYKPLKALSYVSAAKSGLNCIEKTMKISSDQLSILIAEGGEIIRIASINTDSGFLKIYQKVVYQVSVGNEKRIITIREADLELVCRNMDRQLPESRMDCLKLLNLPEIELEYEQQDLVTQPQDTTVKLKWITKNIESTIINNYRVYIDSLWGDTSHQFTTSDTTYEFKCTPSTTIITNPINILVKAYNLNDDIVATSNILLHDCPRSDAPPNCLVLP